MAVDYKSLNEEVNTLAVEMVAFHPYDTDAMKRRDAIADRLLPICQSDKHLYNDFGNYVFFCPLLGKGVMVSVDVYTDTLLWCLGAKQDGAWRYDPERASFITFFHRKLRFAHTTYCGNHGYVNTDSLDEEGTDEAWVTDDFDEQSDTFTLWCRIADIVALQKLNERHNNKAKKTYIESFFTVDISRRARVGVALEDKSGTTDADVFSNEVCEENNTFRPAIDDVMVEYMIVPPPPYETMEQVVHSALRPGILDPIANRTLGFLLENAYEEHPKYQVTRQTAYKRRDAYDQWLLSITAKEHFWKEGYQV